VLSFHATKVFNTFEGGAIVCPDARSKQRIDHLKNFGIVDEVSVVAPGINGKMSEFNAALGLLQLEHMPDVLARRREADHDYRRLLADVRGIRVLDRGPAEETNYSYFPILVEPDHGLTRDGLYQRLRENNIFARRYFYPLISDFPMYRGMPSANPQNLPIAVDAARRILCLPMSPTLTREDRIRTVGVITGD
jgi:dTDP-4-amino-4,6-dideoxygalactose transaminase